MRTFSKKKKLPRLLTLCGAVAVSALLGGCGQSGVPAESFDRSDYYTRGIGSYPGDPGEDFSPSLRPDYSTYRNIALLRSAYNSSSYDYNLTAQLVTDGVISDKQPQYLDLSTQNGDIARREREWMIDQGPYSRNAVTGEDAYFLFTLNNWKEKADKVQFRGSVAYDENNIKDGYEIVCEGSNDGNTWTELAALKGKGMPGKASKYKAHSDPNKNSWDPGTLPTRMLNETLTFDQPGEYAYYRMRLKMEGAAYWAFFEMNFYNQDKLIDLLPSKFFNSAWMSATTGEEWVYVDLGSQSEFDKVKLHWINKAIKGKIQVSDDAKQWVDIANLPGGDANLDEIKLKGKGRYVRVWMEQPANDGRYILSEIEVMGKGGLLAQPAAAPAATKDEIRLSGGNWKVQRASEVTASGEEISKPSFSPENWIVATVPGTVLSSYKNIGAIPNPNYADNLMQISESFFNSNFWYRDEFEVPEGFKQDRLFLNFDGINWKANVYLNGNKIGRIVKEDHPGLHYISSSADEVVSGHGPYRALPVKEYFSLKNGSDKFHSERGMPNVMNYESLVRTFSPEALWPQNAQWGQHDYTMEGAQSCASFNAIIEKGFGKPNNAKEFADLAQWVNYDGYRGMFESRSLNRKGLLLWMTHPAWPSMVWQTYDYYFEPTAAYFGCKKASEPLHIQWNPVTDEIEVVNYSAGVRNGLTAKAQIINMDGSISWENEVSVDSKEDTTNKCMKLDFPASVSSAHFVKLTLTENGKIVSDNFYLRGVEEGNYQALREMPKVTLRSNVATNKGNDGTWTATATLENTSSTPALMIRVNVVGEKDGEQFLPMFYSDNYFSLLPGEKKEINIHWKDVDTRGETPKVVISGYNVN